MEGGRPVARTPVGIGLIGGLIGGLLVGVVVLIAILAGWIESETDPGGAGSAAQSPIGLSGDGGDGLGVREVYELGGPAVSFIEADRPAPPDTPFGPPPPGGGPPPGGTATGSGFVFDDQGHILTNAHVVAGAEAIRVTLRDDGTSIEAELLGQDPSTDVAVLAVDPGEVDLDPVELGDSSQAQIGDPVVAIGNPFGLDRTVTTGIVSALQREIRAPNGFAITDVIQTDAAINPGNSGGPLLDARGQVIGINSQIQTSGGGGSVGVGFAVPINTARDVATQILETGQVERPSIGVNGVALDPEIAGALGLETDRGVLVQEVLPGGPADQAGVRPGSEPAEIAGRQLLSGGDVIVSADGEEVSGLDDVVTVVNRRQPGEEITLEIVRDGERQELTVELGVRPDANAG